MITIIFDFDFCLEVECLYLDPSSVTKLSISSEITLSFTCLDTFSLMNWKKNGHYLLSLNPRKTKIKLVSSSSVLLEQVVFVSEPKHLLNLR